MRLISLRCTTIAIHSYFSSSLTVKLLIGEPPDNNMVIMRRFLKVSLEDQNNILNTCLGDSVWERVLGVISCRSGNRAAYFNSISSVLVSLYHCMCSLRNERKCLFSWILKYANFHRVSNVYV